MAQVATAGHGDTFYVVSERVIFPDSERPAAVKVEASKITEITTIEKAKASGIRVHDYGKLVVMPGIVDSHVHMNEPGRADWEGLWTATRAACAGGVTTLVDMPLNCSPVTTTLEALKIKIKEMTDKLWVDIALLGGIVPGNLNELLPMVEHGVVGFKCFMVHSGIDEFPAVSDHDIVESMKKLAELEDPVVFMFHAEHPEKLVEAEKKTKTLYCDPSVYKTFLDSRPKEAEDEAIKKVITLLKETGNKVPCHIVHLASSTALDMIKQAKADAVKLTVETTYHYLYLSAENIPSKNTLFKCCPPIREASNREKLWQAVADGIITQLISDHSPCTTDLKKLELGDFHQAWGGIASLQLGLPLMWTEASKRGHSIPTLARWMCLQTAQLVKLDRHKGSIEIGKDADFVIWDPEKQFKVDVNGLHMKNKRTPYEGETLKGVVIATFLRGQKLYDDGEFTYSYPTGKWYKRD